MRKEKKVNFKGGISAKNLIDHLQTSKTLILIGEKRKLKIDENNVTLIEDQIITAQNIPDEIRGIEISDYQKELLLDNKAIHLGNVEVKLDLKEMQITLKEQTIENQHQLKFR